MDWGSHKEQQFEVYDMTVDPYQLNNVAGQPAYAEIQADLAAALEQLRGCSGSTCKWTDRLSAAAVIFRDIFFGARDGCALAATTA